MMRAGNKEFYDAMDAFERWLRSPAGVYVSTKNLEREDRSMWPRSWYCNGEVDKLFRAWLAGMSYQRCLNLENE